MRVFLGVFAVGVLLAPAVWAGTDAFDPGGSVGNLQAFLSLIVPLGICPFYTLAALGAAAQFGVWDPVGSSMGLSSPWLWGTALVLAFLLQFGRSFKLTRPLAETLGAAESTIALLFCMAAAAMATGQIDPHLQAGVFASTVLATAIVTSLGAVICLRLSLDLLVWASPFPFVDMVFEWIKVLMTTALIALAIFFPTVSLVLSLVMVLVAALVVRWSFRLGRFAATIAFDMTWGRTNRFDLDVDESGGFEISAFVLEAPGRKKRSAVRLRFDPLGWSIVGEEDGLGRSMELRRGLLGGELRIGDFRFWLRPRYKAVFDEIVAASGGVDGGSSTAVPSVLLGSSGG